MSLLYLLLSLLNIVGKILGAWLHRAGQSLTKKIFTALSSGWDLTEEGEFELFSIPAYEMIKWRRGSNNYVE